MIQIRQTKNDLAAKGFLFFLRIRAASTPLACLQGYVLLVPAGQARIVGECTGDLLLIEKTSIKLALNYPDLVAHTKPRRVPKNLSWVHPGSGVTLASHKAPSTLGDGRRDRIEFRSSQPAQRRESPSRDRTRY